MMSIYRLLNRFVLITVLILSVLGIDRVTAEAVVEIQEGWMTLGDSLPISGTLLRPRICPLDSSYVAYEIRAENINLQYIYHRPSGSAYLVTPSTPLESTQTLQSIVGPLPFDSIRSADSLAAPSAPDSTAVPQKIIDQDISCGHLSWCPTAIDNGIWAAYLAGRDRMAGVYLYELQTRTSYPLWIPDDTLADTPATAWGTPQWSPDGTCLAFTVVENGESDISIARNLYPILEDPSKYPETIPVQILIGGGGNQFEPVWCPVMGSALVAYTKQDGEDERLRIEVFDIVRERSFEMTGIDSLPDYFGPSWNAGGRKLAYYRHENIRRILDPDIASFDKSCGLGLADVRIAGDVVVVEDESPPDSTSRTIFRIVPDNDPFTGPKWLPGGRHLMISSYDDLQRVRPRIVSIPDFIAPEKEIDYIVRGFGGGRFLFPRDVDIYNRQIAFVHGPSSRSQLVIGQLVPNLILVSAAERLGVDYPRRLAWEDFAHRRDRGGNVFGAVWDFLWSPIAGPDIGINRGIVPVAGGIIALFTVLSGDDGDDINPIPQRDWTPPEFPDSGANKSGFHLEFGL